MKLPDGFVQSMRELLKSDLDRFLASYDNGPLFALRVNTSKITTEDFEKIAPHFVRKIPYVTNGYFINDADAWTKHPYYYAGLYYMQEPSAMLPASRLLAKKDDVVLDLCAAPGGKSTQLATDCALLVSNDISFSRTIPLVKNLELFGTGNFAVTAETPEKLCGIYNECFDRILVDAPCSGEGMFRKDSRVLAEYEKRDSGYYCGIQKNILECAYSMLKPGGYLMYSTCTFSDIEDEQVIISFLDEHEDTKLCDIKKEYGFCGPYEKYRDASRLSGCIHVFPHETEGEGHFLALIKKAEREDFTDVNDLTDNNTAKLFRSFSDLPEQVREFSKLFSKDYAKKFISSRFLLSGDGLCFMVPEGFERFYRKNIRYARTGICIGNLNRSGKFIPHTALALHLKKDDFSDVYDFSADDVNVIKYLKGETLIIEDAKISKDKGHVLMCVDGFPLGFAQKDGIKYKNLYEKGWIYR